MNRYQILIEYVGTDFRGWQIQKKGSTIQGLIQEKLTKLLKEKIILNGSGRTDTGVHAIEQSGHFDSKNEIIDLTKFLKSINHFLNEFLNGISIIVSTVGVRQFRDWVMGESQWVKGNRREMGNFVG